MKSEQEGVTKKEEEEEAEEYYRKQRAEQQEILNIAYGLANDKFRRVAKNEGGYTNDYNYCTVHGDMQQIAYRICEKMDKHNRLYIDDIVRHIKRMWYIDVTIPPEYCQPGLHQPNWRYPIVTIDPERRTIYFMSAAFTFMDKLARRRQNCRKACIALLAAAPFQQRCLRRWWVQNMVFSTWNQPEWE